MWYVEDHFKVILGGNTYIDTHTLVAYFDEPIFTIKRSDHDGQLSISFDIYDPKGERIAIVRENRIFYGDEKDYEIINEHERYAFIEKNSEKVLCDIRRGAKAPESELLVSVKLYTPDGFLMDFSPTETNLRGISMKSNTFIRCPIGIIVMKDGTCRICAS